MPPDISRSFNAQAMLRAWCLLAPCLCVAALLASPLTTHADDTGLVGYWSFNEGTGTVATDFSGNGNTGTLVNEGSGFPLWVGGKRGKALDSNNNGSNVTIDGIVNDVATGNFTVAFWFKPRTLIDSSDSVIVMFDMADPSSNNDILFQAGNNVALSEANGALVASIGRSGGYDTLRSTQTSWSAGVWYHAVLTYSTVSGSVLYINGVSNDTDAATTRGSTLATTATLFKTAPSDINFYDGAMDEVRVYNRALSPTEVAELYRAGAVLQKPPNNLGLVGYWSFNEGTGTVATDFSGNGNHGAMTNFANPPTAASGWNPGKRGTALALDGSNDLITVQDSDSLRLATNQMTVSFWLKKPSFGEFDGVFWKRAIGGSNTSYAVSIDHGDLNLFINSNGGDTSCDCTLVANRWQYVSIVFDGTTDAVTFYLDGVVADTGTQNGNIDSTKTHPLRFGEHISDEEWNCMLDEVRIYNRALAPGEIAKLYGSGAVKINASSVDLQQGSLLANGLVGHWTFDGADVTNIVTDRSGFNNHGYFYGGATSSAKVIGKLGQALQFDGVDDRVFFVENQKNMGDENSASLWIDFQDTGDGVVLAEGLGDYFFYLDQTDVYYSPSQGNFANTAHGGLSGWTHLAVTRDLVTVTWYKNGALLGSDTLSGPFDDLLVESIGSYNDGTFPTRAKIDDVRIYNRALSPAEVQQLYQLGIVTIKQ